LVQQFPDCEKVEFIVSEPKFEELLKNYHTKVDDGIATTAEEKGDGMQRALMLAIIKTFADFRREDALGRVFIFFVDEAELHLHPGAQRQLKTALLELSQGADQVFISTHSSVLIADEHTKQEIFRVQKVERETQITSVEVEHKQEIIYQLLGGNPADLLFPANFLIIEGLSEKDFIEGIIDRFYKDQPKIQIVDAAGDHERQKSNMEAINLVFNPLDKSAIYRDKLVLLCDAPHAEKQESFRKFKAQHPKLEPQKQLFELAVTQIEQYYPAPWKTTNELKSRQKRNLAKKVAKEITQDQFEKDMPIVFDALKACWEKAYSAKPE
jgi:putative ATP-dependent endonuclease of OLD family